MIQNVKAQAVKLIEEIELHAVDGVLALDAELSAALGNLQAGAKQFRALVEAKLGDAEEVKPAPAEAEKAPTATSPEEAMAEIDKEIAADESDAPAEAVPSEPAQDAKGDASEAPV